MFELVAQPMLFEAEIILFAILAINLLLIWKPVPLVAFPISLASIGLFALTLTGESLNPLDVVLPFQPYLTLFFILICVCSLVININDFKEK